MNPKYESFHIMYILSLITYLAVTLGIPLVDSARIPTPQDARAPTNRISLPSASSLNSFNKAKEPGAQ